MNTLIVILQVSIAEVLPQLVAAFCAALIVTAASWGIGRIGTTALDSIARQPEAAVIYVPAWWCRLPLLRAFRSSPLLSVLL